LKLYIIIESCIAGLFLSRISSYHCISFQKVKALVLCQALQLPSQPQAQNPSRLLFILGAKPTVDFVFLLGIHRSSDAPSLSPALFPLHPSFLFPVPHPLQGRIGPGLLHGSSTLLLLSDPSWYSPDPSRLMFLLL
jgi:hypothetical protein